MSASNRNDKDSNPSVIYQEISDALSFVEKQLFLISNDSRENPNNFRNRILKIGKLVSSKNSILEKQVSTLLNSDNFDNKFVKETLQQMYNTLEEYNTVTMKNEETKQQIDTLTDIAFNQNTTIDQLRDALKKSLSLNTNMMSVHPQTSNQSIHFELEQPPTPTQQNNSNKTPSINNYLHSENIMEVKRKEDTQNYNKNQTKLPLLVQSSKALLGNLEDDGDDVFDDDFSILSSESQNSRIIDLENRLKNANKQINELKNQLKTQKLAYSDLQEKSKQSFKQYNDMKNQLATTNSEKEKLEKNFNLAKKKIVQLRKEEDASYKKLYETISTIVKQSKSYKGQGEENVVPTIQTIFNEHEETNECVKQINIILSNKAEDATDNNQTQSQGQLMRIIIERIKEITNENEKLKAKAKLQISNVKLEYFSDDLEIQKIDKERKEVESIMQTLDSGNTGGNGPQTVQDLGTRLKNLISMQNSLQQEIAKREKELQKLKAHRQLLEEEIKSIISTVNPKLVYNPTDNSCNPPAELIKDIQELVNDKNKYQAEKNNLLEVQIQVTTERDNLSLEKQKSVDKLIGLAKIMNQNSNFGENESQTDLIHFLENEIQAMNQLLPSNSADPNEPIQSRLNRLLNDYNQLKEKNAKLEADLTSISSTIDPSSDQSGDITQIIENLRNKIKQNKEDEEAIISLLSPTIDKLEDDPNNHESKIIRGIKQLLNELQGQKESSQKILSDLAESLNIKLDPNQDIEQIKSSLQTGISNAKGMNDDVKDIFDQYQDNEFIKKIQAENENSDFNLIDSFRKLCQEYSNLEKSDKESRQKLNQILGGSPSEDATNEEIENKVRKVVDEYSSILKMLGITDGTDQSSLPDSSSPIGEGNVAEQVRKLYDENKRLNELLTSNDPIDKNVLLMGSTNLAKMNDELNQGLKKLNIDIENLPEGETINTALLKGLERIQNEQQEMEDKLSSVNSEKEKLDNTIKVIKSILKGSSSDFDENGPLDPAQLEQMLTELKTLVAAKEKIEKEEEESKQLNDEKRNMSEIKSILSSYKNSNPDDENIINDEDIDLVDQIKQLCEEKERLRQSKNEILKVLKINGNISDEQILNHARQIADQQEHDECISELAKLMNIPTDENVADHELLQKILAKVKSSSPIIDRSIDLNLSDNEVDEYQEETPENFAALKNENKALKHELKRRTQALKSLQAMIYPDRQDEPIDTFISDIQKRTAELGNDPSSPSNPSSPTSIERVFGRSFNDSNFSQENVELREKLKKAESEIQALNEKVIEGQSRVSGILEERESVSSLIQDLTQTLKKKMENGGQGETVEDSVVFQKLTDISNALSEQNAMLTSMKGSQNGTISNENDQVLNNNFSNRIDQNLDRIMSILEIGTIQTDPNSSPEEARYEKTNRIIVKIHQMKGRTSVANDPYGFPELNQSTSDMYNSIMANEQSEQSFNAEEEEEEGDLNDPPTFSRDRSSGRSGQMQPMALKEILNKKNEILKNHMDAFRSIAASLRINPEQYENDQQLIDDVISHVRRLTGDTDLPGTDDEPASLSSEPLLHSDQPYTPRRHNEEEDIQNEQQQKKFKLNLKGIPRVNDENGSNTRNPPGLTRLNLNRLSQNPENENENEEENENENENENESSSRRRRSGQKQNRLIDDDFLIQKLNDISSDLSEQQKILKQMEASHKSTSQVRSLEKSLYDQQGHWNDLRRALGIPEVEGSVNEEEEDVTDIQNRMLDKIKELSALHEAGEDGQLASPRSVNMNSEASPSDPESQQQQQQQEKQQQQQQQIKELTDLLTIANKTIQTYKDEKDNILKILDSEKQSSLNLPEVSPDQVELEPLSEKLDELQTHISANIEAIMNIAHEKANSNNEDTLATINDNDPLSPIEVPKSPIANAFNNLNEELGELTNDNDEKDQKIANLSSKVNGLNRIIIELNDKNNKMINENQKLLGHKSTNTANTMANDENAQIEEEEEEVEHLEFVSHLKEEVDRLRELIDSTSCSITELNTKRSQIMKSQIIDKSLLSSSSQKQKSKSSNNDNNNKDQNQEVDEDDESFTLHSQMNKNSPVSGVLDDLRSQMNNLKEQNSQKDKRIKELEEKNKALLRQSGIDPDLVDKDGSNLAEDESNMSQAEEIAKLKRDLKKLTEERDSIMKSLFPESDYNDDQNASQLLSNLTDLDNQVQQQTEEIRSTTDMADDDEGEFDRSKLRINVSSPRTRRNVQKSPRSQITDAFGQLKQQIVELTERNNELEAKLSDAQSTIDQLRSEKELFLMSLGNDDSSQKNDLSKELFKKLNFLDSQISTQSAEIGDAINTSKMDQEYGSSSSSPVPSPKSRRNVISNRAQSNAQFQSAFEEMKQKMKNLTLENFEKDQRISELEDKIEELKKGQINGRQDDRPLNDVILENRRQKETLAKLKEELGISNDDDELAIFGQINEMKEKIAKLEELTNQPSVQTRHVQLNLGEDSDENDNEKNSRKPLNKAVRHLSNALDRTDQIDVHVNISIDDDEEKSQETIQDLRGQVEDLTKARESIASLLSEISKRSVKLVKQISTLKSNEKGKNKAKSLTQLHELEQSALDVNAKLQSSKSEFNLNLSDDNEKVDIEIQTEQDEDDEEKEKKLLKLNQKVQKLTEAKNSISKLFIEVSKNSEMLIEEIKRLRLQQSDQPGKTSIEESLNKLETTAEDIATHQSKAEAIINSSVNDIVHDISLPVEDSQKLQDVLEENRKLKEQLKDAQLKLEAVKESKEVISELAYFEKKELPEQQQQQQEEEKKLEDNEEEIDKSKQIELLQQKIDNLTKARESIMKLFMEVSRQARSLVEEIKVLKKEKPSANGSEKLESIENSAHSIAKSSHEDKQQEPQQNGEIVQALQSELSSAQQKIRELTTKLSKSHDDNGRSKEKDNLIVSMRSPVNLQLETLRKELVVSDINSSVSIKGKDDDEEKIKRIQKQVESLQKARASMAELFNEVSRRSQLLVKQIEECKGNKKDDTSSSHKNQKINKLETEIKDLCEAQNAIQTAIQSEGQRSDQPPATMKALATSGSFDANSSSSSVQNDKSGKEILKKQISILNEKVNKLESSLQLAEDRNIELVKKLDLSEKKLASIEESDPSISNFIKIVSSLVENEEAVKEDSASLQEKLDNLQEARQSLGNLFDSLAQCSQSLSKSISLLKSENPNSKEISVLETNANALVSSLNREAKLTELTKKSAEYQRRIAELESMLHNDKEPVITSRNIDLNNDNYTYEQLQSQISQIEAVLNDEDVISDFPLVQELISRLTKSNKPTTMKRNSPPPSPNSIFSTASTSDSILKQLKQARSENQSLKQQLADVSEFQNEREDIVSIVHGEIDNVDTKSSSLVRSVMQLYNIAHVPITEIDQLKKELSSLKEERAAIEAVLLGKPIPNHNSSLVKKVTVATRNKENDNDIDLMLNNERIDDDVSESTLVRQIAELVKKSTKEIGKVSDNLSNSVNEVEGLKAQIFELSKQNELKRLELSQISAILNGNDDINGDNFDLDASLDENVVQRLRDTLSSYKNDSRDKLIKEINDLKSHIDKSSNAQLLTTLKQQINDLEESNNELTEKLNKLSKERESIIAVVSGKRPTIKTQLVEKILANNNNNKNNGISNTSLIQQVNEMNNDNENDQISTFNLGGIHGSSSNSSLNDELTDENQVDVDSISSIRSSSEQDPNSTKALLLQNESLRQKLSENKELVNVYAHQFSKIEKFLKLKQVGTIAQRAKAIALKINEERKVLQTFEEQNNKLKAKYSKAKKKIMQYQQQNLINDHENSNFSVSSLNSEDDKNGNNAKMESYRSKLSHYVNNMKSKFLSLVDADKNNALTDADQLFTELELAIHMVGDNNCNNNNNNSDNQ